MENFGSSTNNANPARPRTPHASFKTSPCSSWTVYGTCSYGSRCQFAHGPGELRNFSAPTNSNANRTKPVKTQPCHNLMYKGFCPFGQRCDFVHPGDDAMGAGDVRVRVRNLSGPYANGISAPIYRDKDFFEEMEKKSASTSSGSSGPSRKSSTESLNSSKSFGSSGFFAYRGDGIWLEDDVKGPDHLLKDLENLFI